MRLICPTCDAQYEVPDDVMPPEGRDVQCSNCGQTWFQTHPDAKPTDGEEQVEATANHAPTEPAEPDSEPPTGPDESAEAVAELDTNDTDAQAFEAEADEAEPALQEEEAEAEAPPRRKLDPAVVDVLREEAELEKKARQGEVSGSVESQPDLGLDETDGSEEARKRAHEGRDRVARMRGESPSLPVAEATALSAAAGDNLPDINEINSTLRSNNDRSPSDDPGQTAQIEAQERRSFGRGFVVMAVLVALLACAYAFAPELAEAVPQVDPWLSSYVSMVDGWRVWLDGQITSALTWLDGATAQTDQ